MRVSLWAGVAPVLRLATDSGTTPTLSFHYSQCRRLRLPLSKASVSTPKQIKRHFLTHVAAEDNIPKIVEPDGAGAAEPSKAHGMYHVCAVVRSGSASKINAYTSDMAELSPYELQQLTQVRLWHILSNHASSLISSRCRICSTKVDPRGR